MRLWQKRLPITGVQSRDSRNQLLRATIRSRQRYENERIAGRRFYRSVQLSAGTKPPTVEVKLPQQVKTGQQYNFDAIVQEPLGDDYLLGAAIEEPIQAKYFTTTPVDLELLAAGGLFAGRAPALADDRWVSALVTEGMA